MSSIEKIANPSRALINGWVAVLDFAPSDPVLMGIVGDDPFYFYDSESGQMYWLANSVFMGRKLPHHDDSGPANSVMLTFALFFVETEDGPSRPSGTNSYRW